MITIYIKMQKGYFELAIGNDYNSIENSLKNNLNKFEDEIFELSRFGGKISSAEIQRFKLGYHCYDLGNDIKMEYHLRTKLSAGGITIIFSDKLENYNDNVLIDISNNENKHTQLKLEEYIGIINMTYNSRSIPNGRTFIIDNVKDYRFEIIKCTTDLFHICSEGDIIFSIGHMTL